MDQEATLFVVVGGSSALGSSLCRDLTARGRSVLATYSSSPDSIPASISGMHCDSTIPEDCENLADRAFLMSSRVTVAYLPGISASAACHRQSLEEWRRVLDVNLTGAFLVAGAFLRRMRGAKFGRIIFAGSVTGRLGVAGTCSYSASKEGLRGLTRVLATENAALGITVNCLEIGYMDAGLSYTIPGEIRERIRQSIPAGGFGNPSEITESILFLERASYVTGSVISISGGL
jgi:beta-ketoacyl ACP reductase